MYGKIVKEVGENIVPPVCKIPRSKIDKGGVFQTMYICMFRFARMSNSRKVMSKLKGKSALMIFDATQNTGISMADFLGKRILCPRTNWASERRDNQKVHQRAGGMQ